MIGGVIGMLFGGGRNIVRETAEVFRENAEAGAQRAGTAHAQALSQFAAEFDRPRQGVFDRFVDGMNRLPRPALALGTLALFVAAMVDPIWFATRMQGIALVPEPLWWLLGVIVSFYFGARHQIKSQAFRRELAAVAARAPEVADQMRELGTLRNADMDEAAREEARASADAVVANPKPIEVAKTRVIVQRSEGAGPRSADPDANRALEDWKALRARA